MVSGGWLSYWRTRTHLIIISSQFCLFCWTIGNVSDFIEKSKSKLKRRTDTKFPDPSNVFTVLYWVTIKHFCVYWLLVLIFWKRGYTIKVVPESGVLPLKSTSNVLVVAMFFFEIADFRLLGSHLYIMHFGYSFFSCLSIFSKKKKKSIDTILVYLVVLVVSISIK